MEIYEKLDNRNLMNELIKIEIWNWAEFSVIDLMIILIVDRKNVFKRLGGLNLIDWKKTTSMTRDLKSFEVRRSIESNKRLMALKCFVMCDEKPTRDEWS